MEVEKYQVLRKDGSPSQKNRLKKNSGNYKYRKRKA